MENELIETNSVTDREGTGADVEQSSVGDGCVTATASDSPIPITPKDVLGGGSGEELEIGDITSEQKNREGEVVAVGSSAESKSNLGGEDKEKSPSGSSGTSETDKKDSRTNLNSDVERSSISGGGGGDNSDSSSSTNGDVRNPLGGSINTSPGKYLFSDEMKFMTNFDPAQRLERKRMKKYTHEGIIVERCDCLIPNCPGCHYPCNSCESRFCGHQCRFERTWNYDEIEVEGRGVIRKWSEL